MPSSVHSRRGPRRPRARAVLRYLRATIHRAWRALRGGHGVRVAILVVDRARRRTLERELRAALARLRPVLAAPLPDHLVLVVQQAIAGQRPLLGCVHRGEHPAGGHYALLRLALQVEGRRLTTDELIAALADQLVALALDGSAGAVVPLEAPPAAAPIAPTFPPLDPAQRGWDRFGAAPAPELVPPPFQGGRRWRTRSS